jgi:hypothetical protein
MSYDLGFIDPQRMTVQRGSNEGDALLRGIVGEMRGIEVREWAFDLDGQQWLFAATPPTKGLSG